MRQSEATTWTKSAGWEASMLTLPNRPTKKRSEDSSSTQVNNFTICSSWSLRRVEHCQMSLSWSRRPSSTKIKIWVRRIYWFASPMNPTIWRNLTKPTISVWTFRWKRRSPTFRIPFANSLKKRTRNPHSAFSWRCSNMPKISTMFYLKSKKSENEPSRKRKI